MGISCCLGLASSFHQSPPEKLLKKMPAGRPPKDGPMSDYMKLKEANGGVAPKKPYRLYLKKPLSGKNHPWFKEEKAGRKPYVPNGKPRGRPPREGEMTE